MRLKIWFESQKFTNFGNLGGVVAIVAYEIEWRNHFLPYHILLYFESNDSIMQHLFPN